MTDELIIDLARRTLDQGLCFDRRTHITRSTDDELCTFAREVILANEQYWRGIARMWEERARRVGWHE